MKIRKTHWPRLVSHVSTLVLGVAVGWVLCGLINAEPEDIRSEFRSYSGRFTNPLLECELFDLNNRKMLKPFKYKVEALLQEKIDAGVLTEGSVYFRSMNNGMWFGINENIGYHPASMLKVPIMMAYYKRAEKDPGLLLKKLRFAGTSDITRLQGILPSRELVPGTSYTVDDLIQRMITLSDNNAAQVLVDNIDKQELNAVLCDIDVNVDTCDMERMLTPHAYSGFFRVLYNASYLSREYSEKALEVLSHSEFSEGIRAGLPPGQIAATKFGEWGTGPDPDVVQLHEYGIVYYPGRPYLLGIMTRGRRGGDFAGVIRDVSRLVYESIDEQLGREALPRLPTPPQLFR